MPDFAAVKSLVQREYEYQAQLNAEDATFQSLLANYKVRVTAKDVPEELRTAMAGR
tara:strand:- start:21586 stop:21753 length:168 start_codon:yes stop_codon:yes gene_type:complete